jgi:hypothetical protein
MARKDLLGSTEKKESKARKKVPSKKSTKAPLLKDKAEKQLAEAGQGAARGKKTPTKSGPAAKSGAKVKKKAAVAAGSKAKARTTAKTKVKKPAAPKKPKVSKKDLLFKKFDTPAAKELIAGRVYQPKAPPAFPEAPPFVTGYDEKETKRIRGLLFKQFDMKVEAPPEAARAAAPAEVAALPSGPETVAAYQPPPPVVSPGAGGTSMAVKAGLGALAVLILIIIGTSFSNRGMFYVEKVDDGVQVWRGKFAPIGKELVFHLEGMEMPSPVRDVYSKEEVYPLVFSYFQGKADGLLNDPGGPDFSRIKGYLHQAASYAPTEAMRHRIQARLDGIDFVVLLHRADIALTKGTLPDLQAARGYLDKAASYASSSYQREQLAKTRAVLEKAIAGLKNR